MQQLAKDFKALEEQLVICIRCGMCQSVCPVFEQTHREADVTRGKLALLTSLMDRIFDDPNGVNNRLNKCLLCGSCAANCPSGVNTLEIFIRARTILAGYLGLSPVKKIIFKRMLAKPEFFNSVVSFVKKFQPLIATKKSPIQGTSCARFNLPLVNNRHFLPLASKPFNKSKQGAPNLKHNNSDPKPIRITFFTGCLIDKILPQIAHAAVKIFQHHHLEFIIPENQGCCGIPALASGDKKTYESLVDHHLSIFNKTSFDYMITACATCTSTIEKLWPNIGRNKTAAERLSKKVLDINQFLVDVLHIKSTVTPSDTKHKVTYHDPCHLKKSLGIHTQPRSIIMSSGHELIEMSEPDKCCGMGGSFNLFHYDLSNTIGKIKQESIVNTGCHTIATGCPACIMQISDILSKYNRDIEVKHPIELYADSLYLNTQ